MANASAAKWSPDGSKLGFLAARERDTELVVESSTDECKDDEAKETGDDSPERQLWAFDLQRGGDARQITDLSEGVNQFDWGPKGNRVVVSSRDPTDEEAEYLERRNEGGPVETERLQHKKNGHGWLDSVTTYLFVVDVHTREEHRLDDAYGGGAFESVVGVQPNWGPNGRIAFLSNRTENPDDSSAMDIYTIEPDGADLNQVTDGEHFVISMAWHPETDALAFVAGDPDNAYAPFEVFFADDSGYSQISADFDRTLTGAIRWEQDGSLLATVGDEGSTRLVRIHTDGSTVERLFEQQGRGQTIQRFDVREGIVVLTVTHPSDGADVYATSIDEIDANSNNDSPLRQLSEVNDKVINKYLMPTCERVIFENDGHEIEGIVYLPPEFDCENPAPHPLVVSIHGGPVNYDAPEFDFEYLTLTSRGYIVFCPNFRGSSSYGQAFAEELRGAWGTVEVADIVAGVESLAERGWVDPDRVFGSGVSYGGIAQGFLVTQTDLFTAAAPERGIYDLRADFGTSDSHLQVENEYGLPWENPDQFEASSSITDVDEIDTPLLVVASGEDDRCPLFQSERLYVGVKKQGVDAKLVVYPDEHHGITDPKSAVDRLEQITAWFERHDPTSELEE
jgi:dipeptidyl aminopeptidase/acylaminoacyl peptidase